MRHGDRRLQEEATAGVMRIRRLHRQHIALCLSLKLLYARCYATLFSSINFKRKTEHATAMKEAAKTTNSLSLRGEAATSNKFADA
jgi:hypothetical protein